MPASARASEARASSRAGATTTRAWTTAASAQSIAARSVGSLLSTASVPPTSTRCPPCACNMAMRASPEP